MSSLRPLHLVLAIITLVAVLLPLAVVRLVPAVPPPAKIAAALPKRQVISAKQLPPVEPVEYAAIAPDDARSINAAVPFVSGPVPPARPFRFVGTADDFTRATDCLAAAVYYEAGDDATGERAVAQVVLNRLRHPAFPKTVCGVVFQGSERSTGCQFTFTCDGALMRTPSAPAWARAREIATKALRGDVYKPVGWATHYHTDWVVPYWSSSLDKIAAVDTHLFFRWTGWWGTGGAFNRNQLPGEGSVAKLAALSEAHRTGAVLADADAAIVEATPFFGRTPMPLASDPNTFLTMLNPAQAATFAGMAQASCGERVRCKFMGWTEPDAMAFTMPLTPDQMNAMSFSYIRDRASGLERTLWNCTEFKQRTPCMKRFAIRAVPVAEPAVGPTELEGVRRKTTVAEPPVGNTASPE
ncbi:cell wall hydrolase [Sphingomonas sp. TZW2008]|uniref:cell wall hydrolase n=1 Tax=Sphingomonas sp. TZW2008 TaxID=1917973 RepID=UPI000A26D0C9|nr:cell wall hydrolase [Sphingomonas sp. TZW2008]